MGLVGLAPAIVVAALAAGPAAAPSSTPAPSAPLFTRQTLFSVPFRMDARDAASREVVEVQLYVSTNGGVTWRLYSRSEPQRGNFLFRGRRRGVLVFAAHRGSGRKDTPGNREPARSEGDCGYRGAADDARCPAGGERAGVGAVADHGCASQRAVAPHPVSHRRGSSLAGRGHRPPASLWVRLPPNGRSVVVAAGGLRAAGDPRRSERLGGEYGGQSCAGRAGGQSGFRCGDRRRSGAESARAPSGASPDGPAKRPPWSIGGRVPGGRGGHPDSSCLRQPLRRFTRIER